MDPTQFRKIGSKKLIDLRALDETDEETYNSVYYKEYPLVTADMDETLIVTYSPKYAAYQRRIRESQIERAQKLFSSAGKKRKSKNPNDPMRFIKATTVTADGEIAEKTIYALDQEQVEKEAMYDGFYAVVTNLEGEVSEILRINRQRWQIEENFRIMKEDLGSRPAFVRTEDHIKAHFMTCYLSLTVYRLLEKAVGEDYTCNQLIQTLRSMKMTLLSSAGGYIPSYTRTELTDTLHQVFGFRTDYEIITKTSMRTLIKNTKVLERDKI